MLEFSCRLTCEVAKKRGWMRGDVWKVVRGFVARRVTSQAFERGRRRVKLFIRKKTMRREVREVQEYKKHASSGCQRWWAHTIKINTGNGLRAARSLRRYDRQDGNATGTEQPTAWEAFRQFPSVPVPTR